MDLSKRVDKIMTANIISHTREVELLRIVKDMTEKNVSTILLLDDGAVSGIITERDIVRRVFKENKKVGDLRAMDIMTPAPLITIQPGTDVSEVVKLMKNYHIKSVPVVILPTGDCTGLLTQTDIIRSLVQ